MKKKYIKKMTLRLLISILKEQIALAQLKSADETKEKVTFIYIHGVNEPDPKDFNKDIKGLHKYFANKYMGNYLISPEFEGVFWGQLPHEGLGPDIYKAGLLKINNEHNLSKAKNTIEIKPSLLLNPYYKFCLFADKGSRASAIFFRNLINSYSYDIIWIASDKTHLEKILNMIQEKIDGVKGKFAFVGHSLGSVLAFSFIINRINCDSNDPNYRKSNFDNFVGLITSGDVNNSFHSCYLAEQVLPEAYEKGENNLIRYFIENDKFWISYNHRNDIIGTALAPSIISYNDRGPGFIISSITKKGFWGSLASSWKFWDHDDGEFLAHQWLFLKPDQFAKAVLKTYKNQKKIPKSIKIFH